VRPVTPAAPVAAVASSDEEAAQATLNALDAQENALEAQNEALAEVDENLQRISTRPGRATTSSRSLVIPRDATDAKSLAETEEDMSVMARILEKAANGKPEKGERRTSSYVWTASSSITPRNLYIDGYGALFFMNVNFPLLPPAAKEKPSEPKSESDSEWERTWNEVHRSQNSSSDFNYKFEIFDSSSPFGSSGPAEEYDEDKVSELKENLAAALKNASHIRRLKGDESVTVVVTGRSPKPSGRTTVHRSQSNNSSSSSSSSSWATTSRAGSQAPASRLVIRAKRFDIESFQKDRLSADDFRKKVTMFIY
jgi:hypothetical protein